MTPGFRVVKNNMEESTIQIMEPQALEAQTRAEIDTAIATARRFPRSLQGFLERAEGLATITPEIAASMEYAKPVGGGKVTGPSARLAEIVAASYGNIRVQARVISETHNQIVAQGIAHDLETNVAQSTEITVSILNKDGVRYKPDLIATTRAAACAKARRNAIFLVVPVAICSPIINAARKVVAGDQKTLPERRKAMMEWFVDKGIKEKQVLDWLGKKRVQDITLENMAELVAAQNSVKEEGIDLKVLFSQAAKKDIEDAKAKGESMKMGNLTPDDQK